jgi:hypothetical protein
LTCWAYTTIVVDYKPNSKSSLKYFTRVEFHGYDRYDFEWWDPNGWWNPAAKQSGEYDVFFDFEDSIKGKGEYCDPESIFGDDWKD